MGDYQNLMQAEAIAKITHIAGGEMAMLCTFEDDKMFSRPMATSGIDGDGTMWFMSKTDSLKNRQLRADSRMHLVYAVPGRAEYLSLEGTAIITRDQEKVNELWSAFAKTWFHQGPQDPSLTLLKFTPKAGHYWDTKHSKMVQLAEIAIGALMGKELDDGVEGILRV